MYLAAEGKEPSFSGAAVRITFQEPFYVGLGVCAHNKDVTETAVFLERGTGRAACRLDRAAGPVQHSRDADDDDRRIAASFTSRPRASRHPTGCATAAR